MDPLSVATLMMSARPSSPRRCLPSTASAIAGHWDAVALGVVIAVISSAFPYWLEMVAIRRVRAATYGVLLSIEPAIAALAALVVLGQRISPVEAAAMAAVMAAAAGASWTSGGAAEAGRGPAGALSVPSGAAGASGSRRPAVSPGRGACVSTL